MTITEAEMMNRTFGCELEYEGIGQSTAAKTVAEVTGGTARFVGGSYGTWEVTMPDGRKWKVVSDGSLCGTSSETVTPVMTVADLDTLQKVVRALRRKGAKANSRTGLHVHVGAADFTAANNRKEKTMTKTVRTVKVKAGQEKPRERIKDALAQKGARANILINKLAADNKAVVWRYAELDAIALELRHLAFQIRTLKNAKTATEEA